MSRIVQDNNPRTIGARTPIACALFALAVGLFVLDPKSSFADEASLVEACDAGSAASCDELAGLYFSGASENPVKWVTYAEKACNLNVARACNNLGVMWSLGGRNLKVDLAKGNAYYKKACELSHGGGCFNFANMHRLGEGVAIDTKLAFEHYSKACDLRFAAGCTELAIMYYEGKVVPYNFVKASALFQYACKLGSQTACKDLERLSERAQ